MDNTYLWLKSIHILGVIIFLGNILITGWWKLAASRTRDPAIIAFAQRHVTRADWLFTLPGVLMVLAGGFGNAWLHGMHILETYWLAWGSLLFLASGLIWVAILLPLQLSLERMARQFASGGTIPERYWRQDMLWMVFGVIATALPLVNIYWMVFKTA